MKSIAIIGGGAAGMVAAIEAAHTNPQLNITIYERMDRVGKKLLATGNGRCNYTNMGACVDNYYGRTPEFVLNAFNEYTVDDTINFFNSLGIFPREEERGKLYPFSGQASAVLDALRNELERLGITVVRADIKSVRKTKKGFKLSDNGNDFFCDRLIMAAGGCASPSLGSNGSGFTLLEGLGHHITALAPALVQLKTPTDEIKALQGIKLEGTLTVISRERDEVLGSDSGEILFTDYGISGPPVFQLSTLAARYNRLTASIDFMSEYPQHAVYDILEGRARALSHLTMENYFVGLLNKRLGNIIARRAGIEKLSFPVSKLNKALLWNITALIKDFRLEITGTKGFANAQVTAGGVLTSEFSPYTMESKICKGLYCAGEIYDIFGDCGGYNLQWAWSSGRLAGRSAATE
jgi:predicted Rossmann fold flavoprotein